MAQKKQKQPKVTATSPLGTFAYTWLAKPDEGYERKDKDNPKYKVTVLIPKEGDNLEFPAVRTKRDGKWETVSLDELQAEFGAEVWGKMPKNLKSCGVRDGDEIADEKDDKEEFRGMWLVDAKSKFKPKQYDAAKDELPASVNGGSGDLGRISFTLFCYGEGTQKGISLQLRTVQIVEKRAQTGEGSADDFDDDMDDYEGGYTASVGADDAEDPDGGDY